MENQITSQSIVKHKWAILIGTCFLGFTGVLLILLASLMVFQNPAGSLPQNTCPTEITTIEGSPKAVYGGAVLNMSAETYSWVMANCGFNNLGGEPSVSKPGEKPVLSGLGVEFGKYNALTGRAGDFVMNKDTIASNWNTNKIFMEFGSTLPSGVVSPEFGYNQLALDTEVKAVVSGKIVETQYQEFSNDYAVTILFGDTWAVNYDHLTNVQVREGDQVEDGQVLGKVSPNKDGVTGSFEIGLKEATRSGETTYYCLMDFLSPGVRADYESKVTQLMADWETVYGDSTIYSEDSYATPGCLELYFEE